MADLEAKALDAKTELAIADALDEIRMRNARLDRTKSTKEQEVTVDTSEDIKAKQELEDEEAARQAFRTHTGERVVRVVSEEQDAADMPPPPPVPSFQRTVKKKKPNGSFSALGIKRKEK